MHTVCKVIQSRSPSKDSHDGTQRGETTPVYTVCKVIQCSIQSKETHDGAQRGETTPEKKQKPLTISENVSYSSCLDLQIDKLTILLSLSVSKLQFAYPLINVHHFIT